jgi:hypothetical protein
MTSRTFKMIAVVYLVKTLVIAAAWVAVPDLPERATAKARAAWATLFAPAPRHP